MRQTRSRLSVDIVAGLAVFFSMSYAAFATPILLRQVGMPPGPVFYATCLMAAVASFGSGAYAGSPAALAPGLAVSGALAQFLAHEPSIGWESALIVCFGAGIVLLWASWSGFRRRLVDAIPRPIKLAVTGGIGAVLADSALKLANDQPGQPDHATAIFCVGLGIIVLGYFILRGASISIQSRPLANALDLLGRASFFVSVVVVAILEHWLRENHVHGVDAGSSGFIWSEARMGIVEAMKGACKLQSFDLFIFVMYILLADLVGSPYHLALDDLDYRYTGSFSSEEEQRVKRSFIVDSLSNIVAPLLGAPPVVYFAENFAGKVLGGRGAAVAYVSSCGFAVLLIVGYALGARGQRIDLLIPGIAVAPALLVVGLIIISKSLSSVPAPPTGNEPREVSGGESELLMEFGNLADRLPAAIAIVGTPIIGFEMGTAAGILSFVVLRHFVAAQSTEQDGAFLFLAGLAAASVAVKLAISF